MIINYIFCKSILLKALLNQFLVDVEMVDINIIIFLVLSDALSFMREVISLWYASGIDPVIKLLISIPYK